MIRNLIRTLGVRLIFAVGVLAQMVSSFGQANFDRLDSLELLERPVSQARVLEELKRTNTLRNQNDLLKAYVHSRETLRLARELGDEQYEFVADVQVASIESFMTSLKDRIRVSPDSLDGASPELRMLYYASLIESKIWFQRLHSDFKTLLHEYRRASQECNDPYLLQQQQALDLYVRVVYLGENPSSAELEKSIEKLLGMTPEASSYPASLAIAYLVQSTRFNKRSDNDKRLESLESALECAIESENSFLIIRSNQFLGRCHIQLNKKTGWEKTSRFYTAALSECKKFNSLALMGQLRAEFAVVAKRSGQPELAAEQLALVQDAVAFQWMSTITQNLINKTSVYVHAQLGDAENVRKNQDKLLSSEALAVERAKAQEAKRNNEIIAKRNEVARERKEQQQADDKAKSESLQFFKNLSLFSVLTVLFLAPWPIMYLLRSRLKKVSTQLDSQREVSRESQEKCDELAVRLNRLQRMESLGLMAGSVAHDFNNILVGVMGNAEVIQLKNDSQSDSRMDDDFVRERIAGIIRSAEKAANLSRQMLAYAGKQYIARRTTDLNQLIRQYESILNSACKVNQKLILDLNPNPIVSNVDVTQIEQVVLNLVTNAVEASASDGNISIRTGTLNLAAPENDSSLYGKRTTGGEFSFIEVVDSGSGISAADLERIFEPFFSNSEIGRGLGLSVVYGAVTCHEGFIKCSSNIGAGTAFQVLIPCSKEAIEVQESDNDFQRQSEFRDELDRLSGRGKILVIDDEESVLELCVQMLQLDGWEVIAAVGGKQGLEMAEQYRHELSCILLDVVMPELGASELLRELEVREIMIPVVLMSGFSQTRLEFFMEREQVISIVQKPFRASDITRAVQAAARPGVQTEFVTTATVKIPDHPK